MWDKRSVVLPADGGNVRPHLNVMCCVEMVFRLIDIRTAVKSKQDQTHVLTKYIRTYTSLKHSSTTISDTIFIIYYFSFHLLTVLNDRLEEGGFFS